MSDLTGFLLARIAEDEDAASPNPMSKPCIHPPRGWYCTRGAGHDGPCAAWPRWWNLRGRRWMR